MSLLWDVPAGVPVSSTVRNGYRPAHRHGRGSSLRATTDAAKRNGTIADDRWVRDNQGVNEVTQRVRLSRCALACLALIVVGQALAVALSWRLEPWTDTVLYAAYSLVLGGAGVLVASNHPRNPIGWLMLWLAVSNTLFGDLAQGYGLQAIERGWPAGTLGEWMNTSVVALQIVPLLAMWLLFPTGRLLGRRWGGVLVAGGLATVLAVGGYVFGDRAAGDFVGGVNPYVVESLPDDAMWLIGNVFLVVALVGSVTALFVRLRRAAGVERQQLKWFALSVAIAVLVLPFGPFLWDRYPVLRAMTAVVLLLPPIAMCVAILRYRLYDIDRIISRTISYGVVSAVLAVVYVATVVVLGALVGRSSAWATAGATLAAALAFRPSRARVQTWVDRRFDRVRYDALARIDAFIDDLRAGRAEPEQVDALVRDVTGDAAVAPRGALVGEVTAKAALAVEIAGLRRELRQRLAEVEASRARLVVVADEERRRLERDLHDGAQQRLVSIGLALRHAQHQLGAEIAPDASRTLDGAVAEIAVAIDELRELAHGVRPASLDAGLGPALHELARRAPLPVVVDATGQRFTFDAEAAAYFVACEALTNAVKHSQASEVWLGACAREGTLIVRVADDGIGGATQSRGSGLRGLADRLGALGGSLTIDSGHRGTTITASIPCAS